jgi:uncharacterized protein
MITTGFAATASADKYVQQLIKHWSHRFVTSYVDGIGSVPFSEDASATFTSDAAGVHINLTVPDIASGQVLQGVIEKHLDRFAFREAPLPFTWENDA